MNERAWDRIGSASGAAGILLALVGIALFGVASGASSPVQLGWDATASQIADAYSRPYSGIVFVADGVVSTAFLLLAVFFIKLLLELRRAECGTGWLSGTAIVGLVVYVIFDLMRFINTTARGLAPGHHFTPAEAATFFDLGNVLTNFTWGAIGMIMIPTGIVAIRARALPTWIGWPALVIGLANLLWAWLPPGGSATPAELAFLLWIIVVSLWLVWHPLSRGASRGTHME
jgi:hypothetical protein